jgi:uncharacterized protein YggE
MYGTSPFALVPRPAWPVTLAAIVALGVVVAGPGEAGAQEPAGTEPLRTISVAGTGHAEIEPDEAQIQLGVTVRGTTAEGVSRKAAARMNAVIDSLLDAGIEESDIKTTRLELRQYRQRNRETGKAKTSWLLSNRVRATARDIDSIGDVVDAAIAAGATNLDRLRFGASEPSAALGEAREEAVAMASTAASQLASAAGVEVVGVLSITDGSASNAPSERRASADSLELHALSSTPIEPGMLDISVTVYIEYQIG